MGVTKFERGERVQRTFDSRTGVVRAIEQNPVMTDAFLVRWDDGGEEWVNQDDLRPA